MNWGQECPGERDGRAGSGRVERGMSRRRGGGRGEGGGESRRREGMRRMGKRDG